MDLTREYINAVTSSAMIQKLWEPTYFDLLYIKKDNELYWFGEKLKRKFDHRNDLKEHALWVPQEGRLFGLICKLENPEYEKWPQKDRVQFTTVIMKKIYSALEQERTLFANWDVLFKTRERKELYYFFKYVEHREFPGISLLSTN